MPVPIRRACDSCVKAKRRCDLGVPCCYRCRVRALTCIYENAPTALEHSTAHTNFDFNLLPTGNATPISNDSAKISPSEATSNCNMQANDVALFSFPDFDLDWADIMSNLDKYQVPDQLPTVRVPVSLAEDEIYQSRVIYGVNQLKSYPRLFLETGTTPFIHPALYADYMPESIQDTMSACALIAARNPINAKAIHRVINEKGHQLFNASGLGATRLMRLARAQGLIIFQIIHLFDGDLELRSHADNVVDVLAHMTTELLDFVTPSGPGSAQGGMKQWIFEESVRRTLIMSQILHKLWHFVKDGLDATQECDVSMSFTMSKFMWAAESEDIWNRARLEEQHGTDLKGFAQDFRQMPADKVDAFGVMMIVLCNGVEQCAEWLGWNRCRDFGLQTLSPPPNLGFKSFIHAGI